MLIGRHQDNSHDVYDLPGDHLRHHDAWKGLLGEGCLMGLMVQVAADSTSSLCQNKHDLP